MATSTWSYRRSTNQTSSSSPAGHARGGGDGAALQSKLEQARRQRTAFYRRLAESGARAQSDDAGGGGGTAEVDIDIDAETLMRRQRRLGGASSPHCDVVSSVSSTNTSLLEQPEPRSSWRYYTSYDNGEWRRHATPIYKPDAELDAGSSGKLAERRSASLTTGLTTHADIVDIEDDDGASSHSRQTSALGRRERIRGTACLTRHLRSPATQSSATDAGPTTLDEVKMVMKDVFDRSRYGSSYDVSELVQKILGERLRRRDTSPPSTADRVIYANPDRESILDDAAAQPLRPLLLREIPEGGDEAQFEERTLAPSGRPWTSSPSPDSRQIFVVRTAFDDDYLDAGGLRYEDIDAGGTRVCGTSLENWRDSSCRSPSNVPDALNGDGGMEAPGGLEARWSGALPVGTGRGASETTRRHEIQTVSETSTSRSRRDASSGHRRIPADAVEIKVQMQDGESDERPSPSASRSYVERDSAAAERRSYDSRSPAGRGERGAGVVETERERWSGGGAVRLEDGTVESVGRTSGEDWSRVTAAKSTGRTTTDDGRVWIPVIHVSGSSSTKSEATKSDASPSPRPERVIRSEYAVDLGAGGRGQVGFGVDGDRRRDDRSDVAAAESRRTSRDAEGGAEAGAGQSLRTGSGVGSYGFRSSIVVDRASARGTRPTTGETSTSRYVDVTSQSTGDGDWVVEKAKAV